MSSLKERIKELEEDLLASPPAFIVYHLLPFAIFRYDPRDEWQLRQEVNRLATRLVQAGRDVQPISLAGLLWEAIAEAEGIDTLVALEKRSGFRRAQDQVTVYLSDPEFAPLPELLAKKLRALDPARTVAFLTHAAALAPAIYHISKLMDEMGNLREPIQVPTVLFYPGSPDPPTGLRFMGLTDRETTGNYRVKIYY